MEEGPSGVRVRVSLTGQQAQLLDQTVTGLGCAGRGPALVHALREHGSSALAAAAEDPDTAAGRTEGARSAPSSSRRVTSSEWTLPPGTGKALEVRRGQVLSIEQTVGGQCVDLNCYTFADRREHLHAAGTRTRHGLHPRAGDLLWSRPPVERPMMAIVADGGSAIDTLFPRCTRGLYAGALGLASHPSCQDIQAEAQREYGLVPEDVHDSVNLFMYTDVDREGLPRIHRNRSRAGDRIELLALVDVLAIPNVCADDIWPTSNFDQRPVTIAIHPGDDGLLARLEPTGLRDGAGSLRSGETNDARALRRDRDFIPGFERFACERLEAQAHLARPERELVGKLLRAGVGSTAGEVLRACFLLWRTQEGETPAPF